MSTTIITPELKRGPIGDPASTDPFEWAQARMPRHWHVEGQSFGNRFFASRHRGRGLSFVWGFGPAELVDNVVNGRQDFYTWDAVKRAAGVLL